MPISKCLAAVLFMLFLFAGAGAQVTRTYSEEEIARVRKIFDEGNDLHEQEKYAEALAKYKQALAIAPDMTDLLYNGGVAAFLIKDYDQALEYWKKLKSIDADDWRARTKLIQVYQALGKLPERDAERKELFDLRKSGRIAELRSAEHYVREQTEMAGGRVMIFEHFELEGDRALRYVFIVLNENDEPDFQISLGSYAATNAIWRATTKPAPGKDDRLFHLDGYFRGGSHATYGMFPKEPTLDETREMVRNILEKKAKPVSSTVIVSEPEKKP